MLSSSSSVSSRARRSLADRFERLEDRQDVVFDRQLAKDRRLLRKVADSPPRPLVHRHRRDVDAVQHDAPGERLDEADDHVERRRLPRAIRAQQSNNLPLLQSQGHVVDDAPPAIGLDEPMRLEDATADGLPRRRDRRARLAASGTPACSPVSRSAAATSSRAPTISARRARRTDTCVARWSPPSGGDDDAVAGEPREHRLREMLPHLVEAQAPRLALGVAAARAQRREVVVAVDLDDGAIDVGDARRVGDADQRVQGERGRAVAARELVDERARRAIGGSEAERSRLSRVGRRSRARSSGLGGGFAGVFGGVLGGVFARAGFAASPAFACAPRRRVGLAST